MRHNRCDVHQTFPEPSLVSAQSGHSVQIFGLSWVPVSWPYHKQDQGVIRKMTKFDAWGDVHSKVALFEQSAA